MKAVFIFCLGVFLVIGAAGCDPYQEGMELLEGGEYEAAAEYFSQRVKENPEDPRVHHQLAYSYTRLKMRDEAIKHYKKALELKPDYFESRLNLGTVYLKSRKQKQALEELKKAVDLKPDSETARINLAWAYYYNLETAKADKHRQKAIELSGGERRYLQLQKRLKADKSRIEKIKRKSFKKDSAEGPEEAEPSPGATAKRSP